MNISKLTTPSFLLDLDILDENIKEVQKVCDDKGKDLWPMTKTHKSTEIAKMQLEAGAKGFLVGTLDEAEILSKAGIKKITYAYPLAGRENLERAMEIAKNSDLYLSIDCIEQAKELNDILKENNMTIKALIIINSGLDRFGIEPSNAGDFLKSVKKFNNINFIGISTHPGQVYGSMNMDDVFKSAKEEIDAIKIAKKSLKDIGFACEMIATGSTPTMFMAAENEDITVLRPGNYTFYDNIQMSIGLVKEENCALSILASIVSRPKEDIFIIDAGSKCFGLDKGAHGNALMEGYGYIKGHPELLIEELSEEVAKVKIRDKTDLKIGDKIQIIPNHSCSSANFTNYLIGHSNGIIKKSIEVDMRGGSIKKIDL